MISRLPTRRGATSKLPPCCVQGHVSRTTPVNEFHNGATSFLYRYLTSNENTFTGVTVVTLSICLMIVAFQLFTNCFTVFGSFVSVVVA